MFVLPGSGDLRYLLERQLPVELRIFENSFDDEGYLNERLAAAAAEHIDKLDAKTLAARRKAQAIARGGSKQRARGRTTGAQPPATSRARGKRSTAAAPPAGGPAPKRQSVSGAGRRAPAAAAASGAAAPAPAAAAAAAAKGETPQQQVPDRRARERGISQWQSCAWEGNSCGYDVDAEVLTAVTLRLRALWRSTGGAAPLPSDARPERLLAESAAAAAAWEFVSARLQVLHGDVASKRPAMMALTRHRDEMRSQLVGERRRDDGPNTTFQRTSFSNAEWSLNRLMRPPESGGLWLSAAPQSHHKRCGCARRLREAVDNATFNRLQPLRLAAYDGDVFDAFASLVATEWTPCAACGQMGATSRAVLRGYDTSAAPAPGSWCTAGSAPPLLALALDGPPAGEKPAVVHRDRVRVLRLPNGTPVHYRPIALTYLGGGHYICDVDEAKADPTEPPKWVRFDHMEKGGCGVPLAAASIRKGDDRVAWEGKGPYLSLIHI